MANQDSTASAATAGDTAQPQKRDASSPQAPGRMQREISAEAVLAAYKADPRAGQRMLIAAQRNAIVLIANSGMARAMADLGAETDRIVGQVDRVSSRSMDPEQLKAKSDFDMGLLVQARTFAKLLAETVMALNKGLEKDRRYKPTDRLVREEMVKLRAEPVIADKSDSANQAKPEKD